VTAALPKQSSCRDVPPVTLPRCEHRRELTDRRMTSCLGSWNPQRSSDGTSGKEGVVVAVAVARV
jgi:hypothetical protein